MKAISALFLLFLCPGGAASGQSFALFSADVSDSFDIYIDTGPRLEGTAPHYVYYLDAGINSGKELRRQLSLSKKEGLANTVFVGIAHRGNFHAKRRRDFIPPDSSSSGGHADRFYRFLSGELRTAVERRYGASSGRSLVGHSFGGLFVFYALFREGALFDRYYALSPSLWVDKYAILQREADYYKRRQSLPVALYLGVGSGETLNYILPGARRMKALLEARQYAGLRFEYAEHPGKTHNSAVPLSVAYLLRDTGAGSSQ